MNSTIESIEFCSTMNLDINLLKSQILNNQLLTHFKTKIIQKLILTNIETIDCS